jgi:predicted nucleotidyltransferase
MYYESVVCPALGVLFTRVGHPHSLSPHLYFNRNVSENRGKRPQRLMILTIAFLCCILQNMEISQIPLKYRVDIEVAITVLKNEGCRSVLLFGSLVTGKIHENSDIDIGITGLPANRFFRVYLILDRKLSNKVDLVDFDDNIKFYTLLNSLGEVLKIG